MRHQGLNARSTPPAKTDVTDRVGTVHRSPPVSSGMCALCVQGNGHWWRFHGEDAFHHIERTVSILVTVMIKPDECGIRYSFVAR
jgi:hypothetical protein